MYFGTKSYLKSNRNHTAKHKLYREIVSVLMAIILSKHDI
jgi:hypothetical protein